MKIIISILQRVVINHFYKINAGFCLFLFLILFGMPYNLASFHLSLIQGIIKSQVFLFIALVLWLLYNMKCINYIIKQILEPKQNFLFCLNNLSSANCYLYMVFVHVMVYMPVLIYAAIVATVAAYMHYYYCMIMIIVFNIFVIIISAGVYLFSLQRKVLFIQNKWAFPFIRLQKPLFSIPLFFIWNNRKQMLFVTKLFSLCFLFAFVYLYEPDHYDIRPLLLCCIVCVAAHSAIVFQIRNFEEEYLLFSKNLSIAMFPRFIFTCIMYCVLLLPEFIFLWKGYPTYFNVKDYPQLVFMLLSLICLLHSILLIEDISMDNFMRIVFGILTGLFFIILYNPGLVLSCFLLIVSFGFYFSYYYDYEKNVSKI